MCGDSSTSTPIFASRRKLVDNYFPRASPRAFSTVAHPTCSAWRPTLRFVCQHENRSQATNNAMPCGISQRAVLRTRECRGYLRIQCTRAPHQGDQGQSGG
eukprot:scaffold135016_cov35-Tisochrysis_lutea.AAC.2